MARSSRSSASSDDDSDDSGTSSTQTSASAAPQQQSQSNTANDPQGSGKKRLMLYLIIGIAAIVIIVIIAVYVLSGSSSPSITRTSSANSTPIYMSAAGVQALLGSPPVTYQTFDLYNPAAPVNMSTFAQIVPPIATNASSGWITFANASAITTNATIQYVVITTNNTQTMSQLLGESLAESIGFTPTYAAPGNQSGFSYNYDLYKNTTFNIQVLYGWKGQNAVAFFMTSKANYTANESQILNTITSNLPLH